MSEIQIGELKSDFLTELDSSDTEQIFGGTGGSYGGYRGYFDGKFSFKFKSFNLKDLLDKIPDGFKLGKKKAYSYSHTGKDGDGIFMWSYSHISKH